MRLNIQHLSHSSLTMFVQCPRQWAARYVDGYFDKAGPEAAKGTHFEKIVCEEIGFPITDFRNDENKTEKIAPGEYRKRFSTPEIDRAVKHYLNQGWAWREAKAVQVPIEITPAKWRELAGRYNADPELPIRLIGFVDILRHTPESDGLADALRPVEIVDLKTINKDAWKPDWARQTTLYSLALSAARWSIHRFVWGMPRKLACKSVDMETAEARELARQTMNHTAYYARLIKQVVEDPGLVDHLPRVAGFHCNYCPLQPTCVSGKAFDYGGLPGKIQWAGEEETGAKFAAGSADELMGLVQGELDPSKGE